MNIEGSISYIQNLINMLNYSPTSKIEVNKNLPNPNWSLYEENGSSTSFFGATSFTSSWYAFLSAKSCNFFSLAFNSSLFTPKGQHINYSHQHELIVVTPLHHIISNPICSISQEQILEAEKLTQLRENEIKNKFWSQKIRKRKKKRHHNC